MTVSDLSRLLRKYPQEADLFMNYIDDDEASNILELTSIEEGINLEESNVYTNYIQLNLIRLT